MRGSHYLSFNNSKHLNEIIFGISSITEFYDRKQYLTDRLLNLIDESNESMRILYKNPKLFSVYNCIHELTKVENEIPERLILNENVEKDQLVHLSSLIFKNKVELFQTIKELENLELQKQFFLQKS